jgi:hypothetical protein
MPQKGDPATAWPYPDPAADVQDRAPRRYR